MAISAAAIAAAAARRNTPSPGQHHAACTCTHLLRLSAGIAPPTKPEDVDLIATGAVEAHKVVVLLDTRGLAGVRPRCRHLDDGEQVLG